MSNEGYYGGQTSTTTVSTVAVQAGDSRIIIAILKSGSLVQIQIAESEPSLLEIGSNQDETKKLLTEHELLMTKLKKHETGVWSLLEEADKIAEGNEDEKDVYGAMAKTLSEAWKALIDHLEKRRALLYLASEFLDKALEFAIKIDEAEDFHYHAKEFHKPECLKELLQKQNCIKKVLLEKSMALLNKSQELLDFIRNFKVDEAVINHDLCNGACSSCLKVESLMEMLQDRRRQVGEQMKRQRLDLEQILHICHWDQQEQEVTQWFKENAEEYLERDQLGSTLSENEDLLQEYREFELKAKDWSSSVVKLIAQASEILMAESYTEKEFVMHRNQKLKALHEEFWHLMKERWARLQETNAFFISANKAFEVLGNIESHIKGLKSRCLSLPELAKKHEELQRNIKETAAEALQRGHVFLNKTSLQSIQVNGVKKMMGYIQERVEQLSGQCYAHKELTSKRQQLITSFEDLVDKVSGWIQNCSSYLSSSLEPGLVLSESEDVLNKHLEFSSQAQGVANELEVIAEIIKELKIYESSEVTELSNKACLLKEELKTLTRNICARTENLKSYVTFLRSAEEIDEQMQSLQEYYKLKPTEDNNDEDSNSVKETADSKWQSLLERFLTMQDLGNNFLTSAAMVTESLNLNVRTAMTVVENTVEDLNKKKVALTDMWTTWQLHVNQMKSVRKQWKKFKEQLKKTVHDLKTVEDVLAPASKVDLGSDLQAIMKLQENFNLAKPQFLQLNAEVEYMVKISELLALKGIPIKEKNEKVTELLQLHQRVKDKTREYEAVLNMAVKFHQLFDELGNLLTSEPVTAFHDISQAKIQLSQHQERQNHIRHVYKLAIALGVDISNTVEQSATLGFSVHQLQEKLKKLECGSVNWSLEADKCKENLLSNVHYCAFKEEISEMKESFKDLKKKFNNLKFNYMKKNDKSRNLKAVQNQIQQIEIYLEKIQTLKKKVQNFSSKVSTSIEKHLSGSGPREIEEAINELQKQVNDFDKTVDEYKQNLDMSVRLQQAMEEYQFWCDEASATIVRVGKYSSECKTKEAVGILYKQFEKFVWPTVPQQEERINQITELAVRLHGPEEGKKFIEKTVTKHNEILESIKELCNSLRDLEAKLQVEILRQQSDTNDANNQETTNKSLSTTGKAESSFTDSTEMVKLNKCHNRPALFEKDDTENEHDFRFEDAMSVHNSNIQTEVSNRMSQELSNNIRADDKPFTQEFFSERSMTEVSDKSTPVNALCTLKRKERLHTTYSCVQTFNLSSSPVERERKINVLHQTGNRVQTTPSPVCPAAHDSSDFALMQSKFQTKENKDLDHRSEDHKHQAFVCFPTSYIDMQVRKMENVLQSELSHSKEDDFFCQDATDLFPLTAEGSMLEEGDVQNETLTEESLSIDEYECTSPDDISLPPLSETPESNIIHSETDLDDGFCLSSHSLHVSLCSQQPHAHSQLGNNTLSNSSDYLAPAAPGDAINHRQEWSSGQSESYPSPTVGLNPKFRSESSSFVRSPLTVSAPSIVSSTLSSILKNKPAHDLVSGTVSECQETLYAVHESFTEMQECLHDAKPCMGNSSRMHASPSPVTTDLLNHKSDHDPGLCKPTSIREEIRLTSGNRAMSSLAGQGPNFSKLLSNATVMEGSPVTLEVEVTGFPEPTLTWYRNGQKLTNDEHTELSQKEGKHSLFIQKVTDNDAGLYVVRATNSSSTLSSSAILQVKVLGESPKFLSKIEDKILFVGEDLFLECTVSGRPRPSVVWLKDHMIVASGESRVQLQRETHVLLKKGIVLSDSGKYLCVAKNEVGEACCSACVVVREYNKGSEKSCALNSKAEGLEGKKKHSLLDVHTKEACEPRDQMSVDGKQTFK
uniref:Coiled-coil domain containing 141 n=1 Tax=Lepisosteus oculatus TaxID=7918 RepID=W5MH45_LEPOC|nr:PREDICTED: coiled-coil domain-containing protein 141 isoform X1 [Lepisosteus oculatus]